MGTRNLTMVVKDGKIKVAQYCQWDGYPTGQGIDLVKFIQTKLHMNEFKTAIDQCAFIGQSEIERRWKAVGADDSGFVNSMVADKFEQRWPELSRNTGANVLELIQNAGVRELADDTNFAKDSLFCEWVYVVNLDKEMVEVYQGYNKKRLKKTERFYFLQDKKGTKFTPSYPGQERFYPVKLLRAYTFQDFTAKAMKDLEDETNED